MKCEVLDNFIRVYKIELRDIISKCYMIMIKCFNFSTAWPILHADCNIDTDILHISI